MIRFSKHLSIVLTLVLLLTSVPLDSGGVAHALDPFGVVGLVGQSSAAKEGIDGDGEAGSGARGDFPFQNQAQGEGTGPPIILVGTGHRLLYNPGCGIFE